MEIGMNAWVMHASESCRCKKKLIYRLLAFVDYESIVVLHEMLKFNWFQKIVLRIFHVFDKIESIGYFCVYGNEEHQSRQRNALQIVRLTVTKWFGSLYQTMQLKVLTFKTVENFSIVLYYIYQTLAYPTSKKRVN